MTLSQPIAPTQMKHCWVPSFTETGTSLGLSDGSRDLLWELGKIWAQQLSGPGQSANSIHHRSSIRGMACTHGLYVCTHARAHVYMCTCKKPPTCTCVYVCQLMHVYMGINVHMCVRVHVHVCACMWEQSDGNLA